MDRTQQGPIFFREVQRMIDAPTVLISLLILFVLFLGVFAYFYFIHDQLTPKTASDLPDWGKYVGLIIASIAIVGSVLLILLAALIIEVRPDALYVQYYPIHLKPRKILYETISGYQVLTYRPIRDYGGWGLKHGPKGKVYNVKGNRGVELTFTDGKTLMLGSQRPEEFALALENVLGGDKRV
jgi:vacuolar-type H+-ATPase subunit I/STV1